MENILDSHKLESNITVCYYGEEKCIKGHFHGPAIRDVYLIHYIIDGCGYFETHGKRYDLHTHQGFLICPNDVTFYKADLEEPWHYAWVAFKGSDADKIIKKTGLSSKNPIFTYNKDDRLLDYFNQINQLDLLVHGKEEFIIGLTYMILGALIKNNTPPESQYHKNNIQDLYFHEALRFIHNHYYKDLTINSLSKYLGIDRSYIYMIFIQELNISPKTYIMNYRFKKASHLLTTTNLSVHDIAYSVGYKDALTFSKAFKKVYSLSPTHYRKKHRNDAY